MSKFHPYYTGHAIHPVAFFKSSSISHIQETLSFWYTFIMTALPKTRRRIFFYASALAFLAIAPFLVLYSLGYVVNIQQGGVEKTGGIFVKTNQSGFTVILNSGAIQKSSLITRGLLLGNLTPGQYGIRIEKEGYQPWEKIVAVTQFSVREIRDIILLPDPLEINKTAVWNSEDNLERVFLSPKTNYAALELKNKHTGSTSVLFFKTSENKITVRFPVSGAIQEIIWNGAEDAVLLAAGEHAREYKRLALSNIPLAPTPIFEKTITVLENTATRRVTQADIKKIKFGNNTNDFIMLTNANSLLFWNAATTSATLLADGAEEFETIGDNIFFVAKNGFAALKSLSNNTTINLGRMGYAIAGTPIKTLQTGRDDLFFKDGAGGLFFSSRGGTQEFNLLETEVRDIALDGTAKKIFFLKQNAIGIFHLEDNPYQPFEKRGDTEIVFQSNDTEFLDAAWYGRDNAHIILNTASGVFLLDTDTRGGPRIAELDSRPAKKIFWNQNERKIYLIRNTGIETIAIE